MSYQLDGLKEKEIDNLDFIIFQIAREIIDFYRNLQMSEEIPRRKTTFIIREDILQKAEELGLLRKNLSLYVEKFLERFLDEYKRFLEKQFTPGVGFEPTNPFGQGISSPPQFQALQPRHGYWIGRFKKINPFSS